jgi:hypothetical protein
MRMFLAGVALIAAVSTSGVVFAQDQPRGDLKACPEGPAILATADYLLAEFQTPQPIWHDFEGSDAAYVQIRYGDMPYAEARQLIAALSARQHPPERIAELSIAHATTEERAQMLASLTAEQQVASGAWGSASLWRALIVADGGDWLFSQLSRWRDEQAQGWVSDQIPPAVADVGDEALGALGKRAEGAGLWQFASEFYSLESNLADLVAILDRAPDEAAGTREYQLRRAVFEAYLRYAPFEIAIQPAEVKAAVAARSDLAFWQPLGPLIGRAPDTAVLMNLINQTGELRRIGSEVAYGLLVEIDGGHLDPAGAPDAVLTSMVERLDKVFGKGSREDLLARMTGAGGAGYHRKGVADFIDRAVARDSLAPFMRAEASAVPARPQALSSALDWDHWVLTAGDLLASRRIAEADRLVAADLLVAAGRPAEAVDLLRQSASQKDAQARAHELIHRLDRRCGNTFLRPLPLQEHLYQFDPR